MNQNFSQISIYHVFQKQFRKVFVQSSLDFKYTKWMTSHCKYFKNLIFLFTLLADIQSN